MPANATQTNIDIGSLVLAMEQSRDELLTLPGAATYREGTILARDSATGKLVIFVSGGVTNGNGIPKAILTKEVIGAGAGDVRVRAMMAGRVNRARLVIHADGTAVNVTGAVCDQLRAVQILADVVAQQG